MNDLLEKNAQIRFNRRLNSLEVTFNGYIAYEDFVRILQHEYSMIRYYKLKKCIIDLRSIGVYAPGASDLIKNEWFPTVIKEGMKYAAFLVPENVFGQASMNKAHEASKYNNPLNIEYFKDLPTARLWLENVNFNVPA